MITTEILFIATISILAMGAIAYSTVHQLRIRRHLRRLRTVPLERLVRN